MDPEGSSDVKSCCMPLRVAPGIADEPPSPGPEVFTPERVRHDEVLIPHGEFSMGDHFGEGYPADGELPVHTVLLDSYRIDCTAVTNAMFGAFIEATGFRTDAERFGSSAVFYLLVEAPKADILGTAAGAPWWLNVRGADWRHPAGRNSSWEMISEHPVVQVSHLDALAYCRWAGRALPTEAQWEMAARGGLVGKRFAWGDELTEGGKHRCNIWQGRFPSANTLDDGFLGTAPVKSFAANGLGLYEVAGNIWEWCADWFLPKYYAHSPVNNPQGPKFGTGRVMRGGSYLCHDSYCNRYRVAARSSNTDESSAGNCGFRTVARAGQQTNEEA